MITRPVILGFTPTAVTAMGSDAWAVTADVDDPLEINDGWFIARGDVVFLDLRASISLPGSAGRYVVSSIVSKSSRIISVVLEWGSAGVAVSPAECIGVRGYLSQPLDLNGMIEHPVQQTILIEQEVIDLAKRVEQYAIGTEAEDSEHVKTLYADEAIAAGQFVRLMPTGKIVAAIPQDASRMPATGIALTEGAGSIRVRVGGITPRIVTGLLPGAPVFVGDGGLPITDPAGITLPAAVQIAGVALDTASMFVTITGAMVKRS